MPGPSRRVFAAAGACGARPLHLILSKFGVRDRARAAPAEFEFTLVLSGQDARPVAARRGFAAGYAR